MSIQESHEIFTDLYGGYRHPSKVDDMCRLFRVSVTDDSITINRYRLAFSNPDMEGDKPYTEVLLERNNISLHTNSRGVKYMKFSVGGAKRMHDVSLNYSLRDMLGLLDKSTEFRVAPILTKWFDTDFFEAFDTEINAASLFVFPALRGIHAGPELIDALRMAKSYNPNLLYLLRESKDWTSFLETLLPSKAEIFSAARVIGKEPYLIQFALLDTGDSFMDSYYKKPISVGRYHKTFTALEMQCIHLMFEHLPSEKKQDATRTVLALTSAGQNINDFVSKWKHIQLAYDVFSSIPEELKGELAQVFHASLAESLSASERGEWAGAELKVVLDSWIWENLLEPSLHSKASLADVSELSVSLLGINLDELGMDFLLSEKGTNFYNFVDKGRVNGYGTVDVFTQLHSMLEEPKSSAIDVGEGKGFIGPAGDYAALKGILYSLDDVMNILIDGAQEIDRMLSYLGRPATCANRQTYLRFRHPARNRRSTWSYFDLGVTDPMKVLALRKCRINDTEEITTYAELPDEMFYDLIQLHSGVKLDLNDIAYFVEQNIEYDIPVKK